MWNDDTCSRQNIRWWFVQCATHEFATKLNVVEDAIITLTSIGSLIHTQPGGLGSVFSLLLKNITLGGEHILICFPSKAPDIVEITQNC